MAAPPRERYCALRARYSGDALEAAIEIKRAAARNRYRAKIGRPTLAYVVASRDDKERGYASGSYRRIARIAENGGRIAASDMRAHRAKYGKKCAMCGEKGLRLEADHIVPIARGGPHVISNIQFLCKPCNASKHSRDPVEWAQSRGLLC